jgi:transmembrane sensor
MTEEMKTSIVEKPLEGIADKAAEWYVRLAECSSEAMPAMRNAFQEWLTADPRHVDAYALVSETWDELDNHAASPEMLTLRQAVLQDVRSAALSRWYTKPPIWRWPAVAAVFALWLFGMAYALWPATSATVYVTDVGERRTVILADNSRVDIDAASEISVEMQSHVRRIHVSRGRVYFQVAKDKERPFIVNAGDREVTATGTAFDIDLIDRDLRVTLVEGSVNVRRTERHLSGQRALGNTQILKPGEQLAAVAFQPTDTIREVNVNKATSWRQGKLVFDDILLADAIAHIERYARIRIVVADESLSSLHVSGVFDAGDVPAFIGALQRYFSLDATTTNAHQIVLTRRR